MMFYTCPDCGDTFNLNHEEEAERCSRPTRTGAPIPMTPDPRYTAALAAEQRKFDALDRAKDLILTHPDCDPVERLHLIRTLSTIDRRNS